MDNSHHPRARWRKSTHSNGQDGACVEVATNLADVRLIRDSKDPEGPALAFAPAPFAAFIDRAKRS